MNIGEPFHPNPKMMALYTIYLFAFVIPLYALTTVFLAINFLYFQEMLAYVLIISVGYVPLVVSTLFTLYWIPKFYKSITYCMTESEVRVERGVWWKERHAIPYSRIMNVDTIQGPISRKLKIGTVDIYTAGYTGQGGGSGGPKTRRSEAAFIHIENFLELREDVLSIVKGRPLFGQVSATPASTTAIASPELLEEVKQIRVLLEKLGSKR